MARTTPKNHFTPNIHAPLFGNPTANVPTTKKGTPSPRAKVSITPVPRTTRWEVAIQRRIPPSTGPVQGAATSALTRPSAKAPPKPIPPTEASRLVHEEGSVSSNAPSIDAESARKTSATNPTTHRFERADPNSVPDTAAPTPSAVNMSAMPRTNTLESAAASRRDLAVRAPKTLTVIAIIG